MFVFKLLNRLWGCFQNGEMCGSNRVRTFESLKLQYGLMLKHRAHVQPRSHTYAQSEPFTGRCSV